jgi:glycerate dehydrogenase
MVKIVVLDGFTLNPGDNPWGPAFHAHALQVFDRSAPHEVLDRSQGAAVLLTNKVPLTDIEMSHLPDLRLILVMATGYDIVDVAAARRRGITVCNAPAYSTAAVAELAIGLLLALSRRPEYHHQRLCEGDRGPGPDFSFWRTPQEELAGKTFGVVGYGKIGSRVARMAHAMEMQVLIFSRTQDPHRLLEGMSYGNLGELRRQADVLSLHCPLVPETHRLINADFLRGMKSSSMLINTARGALVDEAALARALAAGEIQAAGIDTLVEEPIPVDCPLLKLPNCIVTPHVGWATLAARRRLMQILENNLNGFLAGQPQNVVS